MEQVKKYEKMKVTSSSGIFKAIYYNDSNILLFGKRELQNFEISWEEFLLLWNKCPLI